MLHFVKQCEAREAWSIHRRHFTFWKRLTFGLPPTALHLVSALSAWLRVKSRFFFEQGII
jgi:hypothetical protein